MPPPIPDTPENIALVSMQWPPKTDWDYLNTDHAHHKAAETQPAWQTTAWLTGHMSSIPVSWLCH